VHLHDELERALRSSRRVERAAISHAGAARDPSQPTLEVVALFGVGRSRTAGSEPTQWSPPNKPGCRRRLLWLPFADPRVNISLRKHDDRRLERDGQ